MRAHQASLVLREDYTTIAISFQNRKGGGVYQTRYTYKVLKAMAKTMGPGDMVVVPVTRTGVESLSVAVVMEVHAEPLVDLDSDIHLKWVVGTVSTEQFHQLTKQDEKIAGAFEAAKKKTLMIQMRQSLAEELGSEFLKQITKYEYQGEK